jgi:soluble epoxide hydrolase / lipid-phosphate phosphatase
MATPIPANENLKSLTIPSTGTTYGYLFVPAKEGKPTLLFLHGFPSTHSDWRYQISFFSAKGYGILAPDLLGYGASSHPTDPFAYRAKKMAAEIVALLDAENLATVIGTGHDWGSFMLSRVVNYYPDRMKAAVFMSIRYMPPSNGERFDLDAINAFTRKHLGFEMFGYWRFFEREDAGGVLGEHVGFVSFFSPFFLSSFYFSFTFSFSFSVFLLGLCSVRRDLL